MVSIGTATQTLVTADLRVMDHCTHWTRSRLFPSKSGRDREECNIWSYQKSNPDYPCIQPTT